MNFCTNDIIIKIIKTGYIIRRSTLILASGLQTLIAISQMIYAIIKIRVVFWIFVILKKNLIYAKYKKLLKINLVFIYTGSMALKVKSIGFFFPFKDVDNSLSDYFHI